MKAKEVLRILGITRPTLTKYVKEGTIRTETMPNGRYEYNKEDVYAFLDKDEPRKNYIYVSTWKNEATDTSQKQVETCKSYCISKGYTVDKVFMDSKCTSSLNDRTNLKDVIADIMDKKVRKLIIMDKYRLSQTEYELLQYIIGRNSCELVTVSDYVL